VHQLRRVLQIGRLKLAELGDEEAIGSVRESRNESPRFARRRELGAATLERDFADSA
jgi:hypothetical protein